MQRFTLNLHTSMPGIDSSPADSGLHRSGITVYKPGASTSSMHAALVPAPRQSDLLQIFLGL